MATLPLPLPLPAKSALKGNSNNDYHHHAACDDEEEKRQRQQQQQEQQQHVIPFQFERSLCTSRQHIYMTTPNLYDEKEVMEEFISCYRHFTALWDNSSMDYLSKKKKAPGYQELLKILRRVNREASVQDVKRKINSLRCCYRREIKKIQASYDGYEPRLWWFHMMDFLKPVLNLNVSTPPRIKHESQSLDDSLDEASLHEEDIFAEPFPPEEDMLVIEGVADGDGDAEGVADSEGVLETDVEQETLSETRHKSDLKIESKYQTHSNSSNSNNNSSAGGGGGGGKHAHPHSHPHPYGTARQQQQQQHQQPSRRSIAAQHMRRRRRSSDGDHEGDYEERSAAAVKKRRQLLERSMEHAESECDLIGKRMAAHFRNMRADQRLFAERIISEVLVFGRMNRLSLDARFLPNGSVGDLYARDDVK